MQKHLLHTHRSRSRSGKGQGHAWDAHAMVLQQTGPSWVQTFAGTCMLHKNPEKFPTLHYIWTKKITTYLYMKHIFVWQYQTLIPHDIYMIIDR